MAMTWLPDTTWVTAMEGKIDYLWQSTAWGAALSVSMAGLEYWADQYGFLTP